MTWRWPWIRTPHTGDEAAAVLARLTDADEHIERLGREMRAHQRRNNFSGMVDAAMHRVTRREE
jgi:hypothetical protein